MATDNNLLTKVRKKLVHSLQGFGYDQNLTDVAGNFLKASPDTWSDSSIRQMMEKTYPTALKEGKIEPWKDGDFEKGRKPPIRIQERMDMMRLATDQPQVYNTMKKSEYIPTKGSEEGDIFYKFRDDNQMKELYKHLKKYVPDMKKGETYQVGYSGDIPLAGKLLGLGKFQVSLGEDKGGRYVGIYDEWDVDKKWVPNWLEESVFPAFNFYDRIYYDEADMIDEMYNKPELKLRRGPVELPPLKEIKMKKKPEDAIIDFMRRIF